MLAQGYCRLVTVGIDDKKKIPIPSLLRERLARYTILPAEAAPTPGDTV